MRSLLILALSVAAEVAYANPSADVLASVRELMAGRNFRAEDGMRQSYGELLRDGSDYVLLGYAIRPDGTILRVVDRMTPVADGVSLAESVVGVPGAWLYSMTPLKGGGFIVRPRESGGRFVSRECRADGRRSVCIKVVRGAGGRLAKVRYLSAP